MAEGPFVKLYHVDLENNFPDVYHDARLLGTLVQLLAVADAMWPKLPEVPRSVRNADVKALEKAGLLTQIPPYQYSIKGLNAERTRRADSARNAAGKRWAGAGRNAAGSAASIPNRGIASIKPESEAEADQAAGYRTNDQPPIEEPLRIWLDGHGAHLDENGSSRLNADLIQLAERDGTDVVLAAFERLAKNSANRTTGETWLLDLKTGSGVYPETALQLAAYGAADFIGRPGITRRFRLPRASRFGVVHVRPEGARLIEYQVGRDTYAAFLEARRLHTWQQGPAKTAVGAVVTASGRRAA